MRSIDCIDGKCSSDIWSPTCTFPRRFQTFFFIMFRYQHLNSGKSQNHVNSPPSTPSPKEILILCSFTHFSHRPVKCVIASTAARQRDKERQSWQKDTYWQWGMGKPAWGTCVRSVEGSRVQRPCEHPLVGGCCRQHLLQVLCKQCPRLFVAWALAQEGCAAGLWLY